MRSSVVRSILATVAVLSLSGGGPASAREPEEDKLARALKGLAAGKPVDCLTLRKVRSSRIIDGTAILFEASGILYVNRPVSGAESLSASLAMLTKTATSEICRGEAVQLFDAASQTSRGLAFLGQFVPYKKAAAPSPPPSFTGGTRY